jgi:hypothetical protein
MNISYDINYNPKEFKQKCRLSKYTSNNLNIIAKYTFTISI